MAGIVTADTELINSMETTYDVQFVDHRRRDDFVTMLLEALGKLHALGMCRRCLLHAVWLVAEGSFAPQRRT